MLAPQDNKFHRGAPDGKHYWRTPPELRAKLELAFKFSGFDPCPWPKPPDFDGLTCDWGQPGDWVYVNPPFGSIPNPRGGRKLGPTAWMRKAIEQQRRGLGIVLVYPVDKWVLMMLAACGVTEVWNLGDVRWLAIEDGSQGNGTGRHIAAFILRPL